MDKEYAQYLIGETRKNYNSIAEEFGRTRRFAWNELFPLARYANSGDRILDLGCGNGRLLQIFNDINVDYVGIDNSEKLIEMAKKEYPDRKFQVADALKLPFPDNYFDKVYSVAVFHHIPSVELRSQFLKEAKRVLKPNGFLILTVWNLWQWIWWKANVKYLALKILGLSNLDFRDVFVPWGKSCQRYIHGFTKKELTISIEKAGFKAEKAGIIKRQAGRGSNIYVVAKNKI